jgi:transcriptional regulator with XRE-family HTH domain
MEGVILWYGGVKMNYKQIGNKIREFRMEKNLTQEEFAEQIGISVSYVGQIERGQRKASIKTLESIEVGWKYRCLISS